MGEIRPLGSEKLNGNDKLQRILDLTYYQKKSTIQNKTYELVENVNGFCYGITKEKDGYYVKKGLNESSLDYIGGIFMKNKNKFKSYAEAFKRLEFLKGQDVLSEATKYVLKNNTTSQTESPTPQQPIPDVSAPAPAPAPDTSVPSPDTNVPSPDVDPSEELPTQVGDETDDSDPLKAIQKLSGKLGQKLREYNEDIESDDIKYVINMVLSAVDLEKLEDTDKEEIVNKIEGDEDSENGFEGDETQPLPNGEEQPENTPEDELGEIYSSLEELTNTDFDFGDDDDFGDDYDGSGDWDDDVFDNEENNNSIENTDQELDELLNYFSREKDIDEDDDLKWYGDEELDEDDGFGQFNYVDELPDVNDQSDALYDELDDRFNDEDYGTSSRRNRRDIYSDELSLNEIKNLINKKTKK